MKVRGPVSGWLLFVFRAFCQIILGPAHSRTLSHAERRILDLELGVHPAIVTHADQASVVGQGEHRVVAFQLGHDPFNRALDAEQLAAFDAGIRLLFLQYLQAQGGVGQVEPGGRG